MKSLPAVVTWLAVLCGLATAEISSPPRRPNVILFLVDDMGWMDCSPMERSTTRRRIWIGSPGRPCGSRRLTRSRCSRRRGPPS